MEKVSGVHQAAFAFVGSRPSHFAANSERALQEALFALGIEWDGANGPGSVALRDFCFPPISDRDMYGFAAAVYGIYPVDLIRGRGWFCKIIDFSGHKSLGSGRMLVVYETKR
jgi:hypothetical protein